MGRLIKVLASANAQVIPLLVIMQEASWMLRGYGISLVDAGSSSFVTSLTAVQAEGVQFGLFNIVEGGEAVAAGRTAAKLVAVFLWGAPVIFVRSDVQDNDWAALTSKTGLTTSRVDAPLYALAADALFERTGSDVKLVSATFEEVAERAVSGTDRPPFFVLPEPEATQFLVKLARSRSDKLAYRRFADVTTLLHPSGVPLGGLWVMTDNEDVAEFTNAFEASISYIRDKENRGTVARAISEGFHRYFGGFRDLTPEAAAVMMDRGNIIYHFEKASAVREDIARVWRRFGLAVDESIFFRST